MKDAESALKWIVTILNTHKIPFQIAGGFAARLYGSTRELADIDIDIAEDGFDKILPEIKQYTIYGPEQYTDENWNLKLMTLEYAGQLIDISGQAKIFDKNKNKWVWQKTDFSNNNPMIIYGITIPVIQKDALVAYKSKLMREVDKEDIKMLLE